MTKRLFVCCDGTWNAPTDVHDGVPVPTNVVRFYNALAEGDAKGVEQRRYYHPGIGTEQVSWFARIWAGMTGAGLAANVKSAYAWLSTNHEDGDEIYLVGFSRGAFTVRSLSGLVSSQGIPRSRVVDGAEEPDWGLIEAAYKRGADGVKPSSPDERFRHPPIHFLGVWDTVGALGVPPEFDWLPAWFLRLQTRFHDTELAPAVANAYHALALDEMRRTFSPSLWTRRSSSNREVVQMWFAGVHADVGGGYRETGLSDITLRWMIDRAADLGAKFRDHMLEQIGGDARGVLHDSRLGAFRNAIAQPRRIPDLDEWLKDGPVGQAVHVSVQERRGRPPISKAPYRPTLRLEPGEARTFRVYAKDKWNDTGLYVYPAQEYEISAHGEWTHWFVEWMNWFVKCGPKGSGGISWLFPRRFWRARWMSLVAGIANFANPDAGGRIEGLDPIPIGERALVNTMSPGGSDPLWGYLYFYANVREGAFKVNRGSMRVTVRRIR